MIVFPSASPIFVVISPQNRFAMIRMFFLILLFAFSMPLLWAQNPDALHEKLTNQRFETQRNLLNYRFKGGSGEFERVFFFKR